MKRNKKGFTLIEIIVVIAILAIIAAVAVPTAFGSIENARKTACIADMNSIKSAWRLEIADDLLGDNTEDYEAMIVAALKNCGADENNIATRTQSGSYTTYILKDLCPSGGTYMITFGKNNVMTIKCSKHGGSEASIDALYQAFIDAGITIGDSSNKGIDSLPTTSGGGFSGWSGDVLLALKDLNISTDTAWHIEFNKNGIQTIISATECTNDDMNVASSVNKWVAVTRRVVNDDGSISYQSGYSKITKNATGTDRYTIAMKSFETKLPTGATLLTHTG